MIRIAILGFSREGAATLRFLKKQKRVFGYAQKDIEYWILDYKTDLKIPKGIHFVTGKKYLDTLTSFDIIIRSPGIPYNRKEIKTAQKAGVRITSLTKIFFDYCPAKIIGITGTKGKGTTATILYQILKANKKDVYLVGNIGTPALDLLPKIKKTSLVIFELSSFQLQDLEVSPHIAIVLGIAPDHLDAHKNFKEYVEAKSHIARFQEKHDWVFYDSRNKYAQLIASKSPGHKVPVGSETNPLLSPSDLYLPAPHLIHNASLAVAVAQKLGCHQKTTKKAVQKFRGYEHRLEFIKKINGVSYYNDSAATSPLATIAAVKSFHSPIILITGGKDKNLDYRLMTKAIDRPPVKLLIFIGENKDKIIPKIKNTPTATATSLENALSLAHKKITPGDIVLLSPGATSFDMFSNYAERGKILKSLVKKLKK